MKNPHSAGGIITKEIKDEIYIVLTNQGILDDGPNGYWSFPKGHLEEGEDTLEAAYREIYEESGLEIKDLKLIKFLREYDRNSINPLGDTVIKKITLYHFVTAVDVLNPNDKDQLETVWVQIDEVFSKLGNRGDAKFFESIISQLKNYYIDLSS